MFNALAYLILVAIWSTTPLTIKWSSTELSFTGGIFWRILISACLAFIILKLRREKLFGVPGAWRIYSIAAAGIAPNFLLVYWASLSVPSGLISVIFSTVPFIIAIFSYLFLKHKIFTRMRLVALIFALLGIVTIFYDQLNIGVNGVYGVIALLASVLSFSASTLWLQQSGNTLSTLHTTTGGLCFAVPPLAAFWWVLDGSLPYDISLKGGLSILYLSIMGSLLGFYLFYLLLHRLSAHVVSTVGMISPVFALLIGHQLAGEETSIRLVIGAAMVLSGLAIYHAQSFIKKNSAIR